MRGPLGDRRQVHTPRPDRDHVLIRGVSDHRQARESLDRREVHRDRVGSRIDLDARDRLARRDGSRRQGRDRQRAGAGGIGRVQVGDVRARVVQRQDHAVVRQADHDVVGREHRSLLEQVEAPQAAPCRRQTAVPEPTEETGPLSEPPPGRPGRPKRPTEQPAERGRCGSERTTEEKGQKRAEFHRILAGGRGLPRARGYGSREPAPPWTLAAR